MADWLTPPEPQPTTHDDRALTTIPPSEGAVHAYGDEYGLVARCGLEYPRHVTASEHGVTCADCQRLARITETPEYLR